MWKVFNVYNKRTLQSLFITLTIELNHCLWLQLQRSRFATFEELLIVTLLTVTNHSPVEAVIGPVAADPWEVPLASCPQQASSCACLVLQRYFLPERLMQHARHVTAPSPFTH